MPLSTKERKINDTGHEQSAGQSQLHMKPDFGLLKRLHNGGYFV